MLISLIFAADEKNGIGKENGLPWPKMSADLKRFKALTLGHHVIMGRKTHESMGGELPGRKNIVISNQVNYTLPESIDIANSLDMALEYAKKHGENEAFIIGGSTLFKEAIELADIFYLTRIHSVFEADTFLPEIDPDIWNIIEQTDFEPDDRNPFPYSFMKLVKKQVAGSK